MQRSPERLAQLERTRASLNQAGDWYYANTPTCLYINRSHMWNLRRINLRNHINRVLRDARRTS